MMKRCYKLIPFVSLAVIVGFAVIISPPWQTARASSSQYPQIWVQDNCAEALIGLKGDFSQGPYVIEHGGHRYFGIVDGIDKLTPTGVYSTYDIIQIEGVVKNITFSANQNATIACIYIYPESNGVCATSLSYTTASACNWGSIAAMTSS